jgi:hypothetical protein
LLERQRRWIPYWRGLKSRYEKEEFMHDSPIPSYLRLALELNAKVESLIHYGNAKCEEVYVVSFRN